MSNINFGTNIKFVSPHDYKRIEKFIMRQNKSNLISQFKILDETDSVEQCYRTNVKLCCTHGIRTCLGVVIPNKKDKNASLFAHIFHSFDTFNNLSKLLPYMQGDNAILIGQRSIGYEASREIFKYFRNNCKLQTSIFQGTKSGYDVNMAYIGDDDCLFVCASENDNIYVNNLKTLKSVFKHVKIAHCDSIEFLKDGSISYKNKNLSYLYKLFSFISKLSKIKQSSIF